MSTVPPSPPLRDSARTGTTPSSVDRPGPPVAGGPSPVTTGFADDRRDSERPPPATTGASPRASHSRNDPALRTIETAWRAMPGRVEVARLPGNGGRPVVVYVPAGLDPTRPVRVQTYLHGWHWNVGTALADHGVLPRIRDLAAADPQTVFVLPQAGRPPFSYWLAGPRESLARLDEAALQLAAERLRVPSLSVGSRVVDAHSGGGLALVNAIAAGELRADKVNLLDAAYDTRAETVTGWALERSEAGMKVRIESWYTPHAEQRDHNRAIVELAPHLVTIHEVTGVHHNDVPSRWLGTK